MDGILSQEEISALLNDTGSENATQNTSLTDNEKDAIGEIANISMGTAATTLFSLVNRKVEISTPVVSLATWDDIVEAYERPCVFIRIAYTVGLDGNNLLILKENDVKMEYNNVVFTKDFVEKVNSISFGKKIVKDKMTQRKLCALFTKLKFEETLELKGLHKKVNVNAETLKVGELTPLIFTLSDGTKCYVDSTESQFGVTTEGQTKYYNVIEAINENEFWEKIDELVDRYCEK